MENSRSKEELIRLAVKNEIREIKFTDVEHGHTDVQRLGVVISKLKEKYEISNQKKNSCIEENISFEELVEKLKKKEIAEKEITKDFLLKLCKDSQQKDITQQIGKLLEEEKDKIYKKLFDLVFADKGQKKTLDVMQFYLGNTLAALGVQVYDLMNSTDYLLSGKVQIYNILEFYKEYSETGNILCKDNEEVEEGSYTQERANGLLVYGFYQGLALKVYTKESKKYIDKRAEGRRIARELKCSEDILKLKEKEDPAIMEGILLEILENK